jgi:quinol monooxygenase YgiN
MVIGETISPDQLRELRSIFTEQVSSEIMKEPGSLGANFMVEEGGNMCVVMTHWATRETCLAYHSSRSYRQFVAKTQHLLVGNFVVKLFRMD